MDQQQISIYLRVGRGRMVQPKKQTNVSSRPSEKGLCVFRRYKAVLKKSPYIQQIPPLKKNSNACDFVKQYNLMIVHLRRAIKRIENLEEKMAKRGAYDRKSKNAKVEKVMHEFKEGKLHSGSKKGPEVKNRKQAVAIAMKESGQSKKK